MSELSLDLQKGLVGHWTLDSKNTSNGTAYDSSSYNNHGDISNPTSNYFGPNASGYWEADVEQLGAVDGFNDVGKADATANTGYEDIFTNQFTRSDFSNSGDGYYVYMAFAAKWNEIPVWGAIGTWIQKPSPDSNKYQLYILKNDANNSRDEYFRLYYTNNNDTAVARVADPFVWTEDEEGENARIISSGGNRTVQPYTQGKVTESFKLNRNQISNIGGQEIGDGDFAISFWIKGSFKNSSDNYPNVMRDFWGRGANGSEAGDSGFRFDSNSTNRYIQAFRYPGKFDNWTHIACSIDQSVGEGYFYQDGEKFFTDTFANGEYIPSNIPGFFGVNVNWNISISNFRYYDRFLKSDEISALYNMREQRNANL